MEATRPTFWSILVPQIVLHQLRSSKKSACGRLAGQLTNLRMGQSKSIHLGSSRSRFMGEITAGRVIFGPDGVEPILGITIDPASRTLKRLPAITLKSEVFQLV